MTGEAWDLFVAVPLLREALAGSTGKHKLPTRRQALRMVSDWYATSYVNHVLTPDRMAGLDICAFRIRQDLDTAVPPDARERPDTSTDAANADHQQEAKKPRTQEQ
jgi:hypothetical protein